MTISLDLPGLVPPAPLRPRAGRPRTPRPGAAVEAVASASKKVNAICPGAAS